MKVFSNLLIIILAIVGFADASFITYQEFSNQIPPCTPGFQCETVLTSPYSKIGPLPLSALGMLYYATVLLLAVIVYLDLSFPKSLLKVRKLGIRPLDVLQLTTIVGFFFSLYLVFIMGVVIQAWCTYCLISAFVCLSIFIITFWHASLSRLGNDSYFLKGMVLTSGQWLYAHLLKPIFFNIDPETIHEQMISAGSTLGSIAPAQAATRTVLGYSSTRNAVTLAGITFPNRVGLSAGFDYNANLTQILPSVGFGWQTVGTITLDAYEGNKKPRLQRLPDSKALIVNKGLKNIGSQAIIDQLSGLEFKIPIAISIASTNKGFSSDKDQILDITECFWRFEQSNVKHSLYELNISCPNTFGGEPFTTDCRLETLLKAINGLKLSRPVFAKMPADLSPEITLSLLKVLEKYGIAGVIMVNLAKDHSNPVVTEKDRITWNNAKGNLSGKPTFEKSNNLIAFTKKQFKNRFVIVGTGGIFTPEDAQLKLELGADLVQLITGMIYQGPQLIGQINRKLAYPNPEDAACGK